MSLSANKYQNGIILLEKVDLVELQLLKVQDH
jgi:hypothetical protein